MIDEEVNEIIAEFMGWKIDDFKTGVFLAVDGELHDTSDLYTESLDALVPVWERLDFTPRFNRFDSGEKCEYAFNYFECFFRGGIHSGTGETIFQAAAHATAKAIKDFK